MSFTSALFEFKQEMFLHMSYLGITINGEIEKERNLDRDSRYIADHNNSGKKKGGMSEEYDMCNIVNEILNVGNS